jgi:hypothetical protein
MQVAANVSGLTLPDDFFLIEINFMDLETVPHNSGGDRDRVIAEFTFFQQNPDAGRFVFWETLGSYDNATSGTIPIEVVAGLTPQLDEWMPDHLVYRMESLNNFLNTAYEKPVVIYGHCDCGCDRTGEIFGSYYMKWLNMTWEQANAMNTNISGDPIGCDNYLAMQWYCMYLLYGENRTDLNCWTNQPCHADSVNIKLGVPKKPRKTSSSRRFAKDIKPLAAAL